MRSIETKASLLETAAKLLFCKETLGKGPVVEDNRRVGASIEACNWAKGTHLNVLNLTFFRELMLLSYFRSKILFRAIAGEEGVGANEW